MLELAPKSHSFFFISALLLLAFGLSSLGVAAENERLTILMTSGSSGKLMDEAADASAAVLAATVVELADAARAEGRSVLVLDGGRTLLPYAESRFDDGAAMMALLSAMGCQAFAPAPVDLSLGREAMDRLAERSPFPILMPVTSEQAVGLSTTMVRPEGGPPVLVANLLDPAFMGDVHAAGYDASGPATAAALEERREKALRVAVVHSQGRGDSMRTRGLSWRVVEDPHGLDLLVDPDFGQEVVLRRETEQGPLWLVGRPETKATPWTVLVIELELTESQDGWQVADLDQEIVPARLDAAPDPQLDARVRSSFAEFRASLELPLPPAAPQAREQLEIFVLEAMRERADAEVAVLNRGGLRPVHESHFSGESLSREAVMRLLSFDQILVAGEISGAALSKLVSESAARSGEGGAPAQSSLLFAGVRFELAQGKPTSVKVNGRPLYDDDFYRVVSTSYLAAGGDDYPELESLDGRELRDAKGLPIELREHVVMPRLEDAERPFVDLEKKALWRYSADRVRLSFDAVSTSHDASYDDASDSRARASDSGSLLLDAWLWADRELPAWRWENDLRARFGLIDTEDSEASELDDDLQIDSAALFTRWELMGGAHPFANLKLDSEFRRNQDSEGNALPRQFEQTLGAGISWSFNHWPRLRLAAVARHYSNIDRSAEVGATAEAWYEWKASGRRPGLDARLMVEYLSGSDADVRRADLDLRLTWALGSRLLFTPGFNYYLYEDSSRLGTARYGRLTLGLSYSWSDKHQTR